MKLLLRPWRHYVDFRGRSRRLEYGLFLALFYAVIIGGVRLGEAVNAARGAPGSAHPPAIVAVPYALFFLAALMPLITVTVRRFHDLDISGWWLMIVFVTAFGPVRIAATAVLWLLSIVIAFVPKRRSAARFGRDPRKPQGEDEMAMLGDVFS
jgi:uncharacterized membrane protein YhaH (DUF805 family)